MAPDSTEQRQDTINITIGRETPGKLQIGWGRGAKIETQIYEKPKISDFLEVQWGLRVSKKGNWSKKGSLLLLYHSSKL